MPIFQDANGFAVKFFIQKDLPQNVQAELVETVTAFGGRVEEKVPRQGYILVDPGTPEEERLRLCWTSPDRPERFFVPYTFVEACKVAGMLLRQIFIENGAPIPMHIHPSIANVNARNVLTSRIIHSGGDPHASLQSARVILADPTSEVFEHLVKTYQSDSNKYVESFLWVKKCIERGSVVYTPLIYKNPGGRRPGEERTQFTEQDEQNLCNWIAAKIPYKETGGRTGNRLYQQLCEYASDPEYAWVARHTWQSWRERYKKNAARLDTIIARIVEQKKPMPGEKGQYGYVRQPEEKPKRVRKRKAKVDQAPEPSQEQQPPPPSFHDEYLDPLYEPISAQAGPSHLQPPPPPMGGPIPDNGQHHPHLQHHPINGMHPMAEGGPAYSALMQQPGPSSTSMDHATAGPNDPAEEEMEDEPEWAVRIGNAPPPAWGKRKATNDGDNDKEKRQRLDGPSTSMDPNHHHHNAVPTEAGGLPTAALVAIANLHVIDQGIRDIAKDFRFTIEEVKEFYDGCGEMELTRARFQQMRELLRAKFG